MSYVVSIDPGLHATGVAIWNIDSLIHAFLVREISETDTDSWVMMASEIWEEITDKIGNNHNEGVTVVIEKPQIYVASRSKGDPNDLITLAAVVGATVMRAYDWAAGQRRPTFVVYKPAEWKGQIPKPKKGETYIIETRVLAKLTKEERARIELPSAKSLAHNVYDAIGIGLSYLRRQ